MRVQCAALGSLYKLRHKRMQGRGFQKTFTNNQECTLAMLNEWNSNPTKGEWRGGGGAANELLHPVGGVMLECFDVWSMLKALPFHQKIQKICEKPY